MAQRLRHPSQLYLGSLGRRPSRHVQHFQDIFVPHFTFNVRKPCEPLVGTDRK